MRSLLAHTVTAGDAVAEASVSWNALLVEASAAAPAARTVRRADLPLALIERHAPVGTNEQKILRALKEHTGLTLRTIRGNIGEGFHLQRGALVQSALDALEQNQLVVIAGPAGSGKSVIGKEAVTVLSPEHFTFGFRAEEFAQPHFDTTLHAAQVPANGSTLGAILAAQGRKVILIESVERLLERATRDAFSDLMTLARDDRSMRIILTCRDYSVEQVRASFLQPARINHAVIKIPPLNDAELTQVQEAHPALATPLQTAALRDILRNPFFLDKALEIEWAKDRPAPQSEREFRDLFWREIVRADHRVAVGMGRRREEVLQEIAVRRARALTAHVVCNDIDPAVIESLRRDYLIVSTDGKRELHIHAQPPEKMCSAALPLPRTSCRVAGNDRASFLSTRRDRREFHLARCQGSSSDAISRTSYQMRPFAFIERVQPYHRGAQYANEELYLLAKLSNIDKHRRINTTVSRVHQSHIVRTRDGATSTSTSIFLESGAQPRVVITSPRSSPKRWRSRKNLNCR